MSEEGDFRKIIEDDLEKLRFILKVKLASISEIKKEEEELIEHVKKVITSIKEMENALEKEIENYKRVKKGWEKAYADKRWEAISNALREEIENFNSEYSKTKDLFDTSQELCKRFDKFRDILKGMNAKNAESRENELKIIEEFRKKKEGSSSVDDDKYKL